MSGYAYVNQVKDSATQKALIYAMDQATGVQSALAALQAQVDALATPTTTTIVNTTTTTTGGGATIPSNPGDLIVNNSGVLGGLADVIAGNILRSGGVGAIPVWGKLQLATDVTGVLTVPNGGTGISSYTIGDLLYASAATTLSKLADVATGNALISGGVGVAPSWGKIGLTTHVSGDLPFSSFVQATAASKLVGRGSAAGAGDFEEISLGSSLSMAATTLSVASAIAAHALLDGTVNNDTLAAGPTRGDIIVGNSTPKWSRKAVGTGVLVADGTDVTGWTMTPVVTSLTATEIDGTAATDLLIKAPSGKSVLFYDGTSLIGGFNYGQLLRIDGAIAPAGALARGVSFQPTITLAVNADGYGTFNAPTFVRAASGTHAVVASFGIQTPTASGSATVTDAASCYIEGEPAFGTNAYALLVHAGKARFNGQVGVGASPATSAALEVNSTTGAILIPRMTTTQKNALTAVDGMIVYDSTLGKFQGYEAGAWNNFSLL